MGSIFSKPKTPAVPQVKEIPVADNAMSLTEKRRKQAARAMQQGVFSTKVTESQPAQNLGQTSGKIGA